MQSIVLGCTHYPFSFLSVQSVTRRIRLADPALGVASQLDALLGQPLPGGLDQPLALGATRICVTSDPEGFADRATPWLGQRPSVEHVALQSEVNAF